MKKIITIITVIIVVIIAFFIKFNYKKIKSGNNISIKSADDVKNYISQTEKNIAEVTGIRQKYRNKLRNCKDGELIKEYKTKRDECTTILKDYRNSLKVANQIIEDNPKIKEVIRIERQARNEELQQTKTKYKNREVR